MVEPGYSAVADSQLNEIEASGDTGLYSDLVAVCEGILDAPAAAQARSSAITTPTGIVFRFAVPGRQPYRVFWSSTGPTILAVIPLPT